MEDIIRKYNHVDSNHVYPDMQMIQRQYPFAQFFIKAKVWDYEDEPDEDDFDSYEDYEDASDDYEPTIHVIGGRVRVIAHQYLPSFLIKDNPLNDEWGFFNLTQKQRNGQPIYEVLDQSILNPGEVSYSLGDHLFIMDNIMELRVHFPQVSNAEAKVTLERWQD